MIQVNRWWRDPVTIRGGDRVIEARRHPDGWVLRWQGGEELPFLFPSLRKAIRAAKEIIKEAKHDDRVDGRMDVRTG